ncbi:YbaB/EbfC family DNA-binding protein [Paraburkholderia bryophila]|uniref:YbaB/EbfC family DNA-binding protein n=1 Tax=Paraburkholderia bryophila TaxID=420952 RepID=UPI0023495880|nr:YbaB/EbfC family DNA-binding protein [Paraburkholderia bryophila]WCM18142.1 YbaB/EbfC family DNA-binding protein [Paraburkholderia bryophila]
MKRNTGCTTRCNLSGWTALVAVACTLFWSVQAAAQALDVPQPWLDYAQRVGQQFQASLEANDEAANQFHQFLEDRVLNAKADAPPPALVVRAWIGADGAVTKLQFDSLGDPQADATLRQLLSEHPVAGTPPADMRQPLRVRLRLTANPQAGEAGTQGDGR